MTRSQTISGVPTSEPRPRGGSVAGSGSGSDPRLDPEFVLSATGGRWMRLPGSRKPLEGVGTDSREDLAGRLFVALRGENHDGHDHLVAAAGRGAVAVMVEREVDAAALPVHVGILRVDGSVAALQRLAGAWRRAIGCVVVGITGSAGKTTTRRLVHAAVSGALPAVQSPKSFNNHLGVPLTLLCIRPEHRVAVVEVGMNSPGEIAALSELAAPEIGVVTCIGHAHLEGVGSLVGVAREKSDLLRRLRRGACEALAVAPADSQVLRPYLSLSVRLRLVGEGPGSSLWLTDRRALGRNDEAAQEFTVVGTGPDATPLSVRLRLPGAHNARNALCAIAVARHLGVEDRVLVEGLAKVVPEAMRFEPQLLGGREGGLPVVVIDDAYNANPESMAAALSTFGERCATDARRILLLGDMLELGEAAESLHAALGEAVLDLDRRVGVDRVMLVGRAIGAAAEVLRQGWSEAADRVRHCETLSQESLAEFVGWVMPGDAVLVKASRGMALERAVAALRNRFGTPGEGTSAGLAGA